METKTTTRTVTNRDGKAVLSNLRVPWDIGQTVWVQTSDDTVTVTSADPLEVHDEAE